MNPLLDIRRSEFLQDLVLILDVVQVRPNFQLYGELRILDYLSYRNLDIVPSSLRQTSETVQGLVS